MIVDDSEPFLTAVCSYLGRDGLEVVAAATNQRDALQQAEKLQPDVVLVDVNLGDESGIDLARRLVDRFPRLRSRVVLISTLDEDDVADLVADAPAAGFLPKCCPSAQAIRDLVEWSGRSPSPDVASSGVTEGRQSQAPAPVALTMETQRIGRTAVFTVAGELDMLTAPRLLATIERDLPQDLAHLLIDLSGLAFLGSPGLKILHDLYALATARGSAYRVIVGENQCVLRPLQLSGLAQVLPLCRDLESALAAPASPTSADAEPVAGPRRHPAGSHVVDTDALRERNERQA